MKPWQFNYDDYHRKCEEKNQRAILFKSNELLPVHQWTHGEGAYSYNCVDRERMLETQLEGITKTLEVDNDSIPYLEPWHGIGIFAEAFGCPFAWNEADAPWTRTIVDSIEKLRSLKKPDIGNAKMLKYVLDTTEYFNEHTKGEVLIAATDTQSALSNLSLICDVTWMLSEAPDYPEDFHRVLNDITDLIIEFTLKQRALCAKPATPGHTMWSPDIMSGISVSDDLLALVGTEFYKEFGLPYDEKLGMALGGIGVHSCGKWHHNFGIVKSLESLSMVDLAISKVWDPDPNIPEKIVEGFKNSAIPVHVRCDPNDVESINKLIASDVRLILSLWWDDDPVKRSMAYESIKRRWECQRIKG